MKYPPGQKFSRKFPSGKRCRGSISEIYAYFHVRGGGVYGYSEDYKASGSFDEPD